jgi:hypothetical protein
MGGLRQAIVRQKLMAGFMSAIHSYFTLPALDKLKTTCLL